MRSANRGWRLAFLVIVVVFVASPTVSNATQCEANVGRTVSVQGSLRLKRSEDTHWQSVQSIDYICPGDTIQTGKNSRVALLVFPETIIRLDQLSSFVFIRPETDETPLWLEILRGAAHFISRDPRALKIITPFANAGVEGTEFLVDISESAANLTVFEGRVLFSNTLGSIGVTSGQGAIAKSGAPPTTAKLVRPRDSIHWTLYYPPLIDQDEAGGSLTVQAAQALMVGRTDQAQIALQQALSENPKNSDALALKSIIALTQNDNETALALANQALDSKSNSAVANIAMSYVQQAKFDLPKALESLRVATELDPNSTLAWARLAELLMSLGELDEALDAAERANKIDPGLSHTQTVLGFAYLTKIKIDQAMYAFDTAIALDQAAPLPRLGLGLANIRRGKLDLGREQIETAVALDPGNSLMRSYMGKAYYDEKRDKLASSQYEMAKQLDPNDPTPWFYDAIRKQTQNRPVEALHDLQKSISLNDNRAVYRSRLQLDDDLATRSASLSRIFRDLGFEQRALVEGWKSVNSDPSNYSAHRLLADSYSSLPRHEVARVSELLQSQLLQPINLTPIQPQLAETNLFILEGSGPSDASFLEFNPLFTRNRLGLQANGLYGGNETWGNDVVVSGVYDQWSFSAGQFHFESDGFRDNNDQDRDIYNLFVQGALTSDTSIQLEFRRQESETGDLVQRFEPDDFLPGERRIIESDTWRTGLHHVFSPNSEIIASAIYQDKLNVINTIVPFEIPFLGSFETIVDLKLPSHGYLLEIQHLLTNKYFSLVSGVGYSNNNETEKTGVMTNPFPIFPDSNSDNEIDIHHTNAYIYSQIPLCEKFNLTLGLSYDNFETKSKKESATPPGPPVKSNAKIDINRLNPKAGFSWHMTHDIVLRAAYHRTIARELISNQTIEPTQVAGFNQFFDDPRGTVSERYGVAIDQVVDEDLYTGVEFSWREIEVPIITSTTDIMKFHWRERFGRAYLNWTPHPRVSTTAEYLFEEFDRDEPFTGELSATRVRTHKVPLTVNFFHPQGYIARLKATYINQKGDFENEPGFNAFEPTSEKNDDFWTVDASLGYRLPKRYGLVSFGITNLFNESFKFVDTDPFNPLIYPERLIFGRITLAF